MKIYTKTGDRGSTQLFGGGRVSKASDRVDAYGEVDELNGVIGVARACGLDPDIDTLLAETQNALFDIGAELATVGERAERGDVPRVGDDDVQGLEKAIDRFEQELPPLRTFVLPGGTSAAAHLHVARTVARRAERRTVALAEEEEVRTELLRYLNRLSDLLFVLGRLANHRAEVTDVPWVGRDRARHDRGPA